MQLPEAVQSGFSNYVTFSGRATRSEYWYWVLFVFIFTIVAGILDNAIFPFEEPRPITAVAGVVLFLPGLAVGVRRLHDTDRASWWTLLALTGIGAVRLIIWFCFNATPGANRFERKPSG